MVILKIRSKLLMKIARTGLACTLLASTAACNNDSGTSDVELASGSQQGIPIPSAIQERVTAAGTLNANLYCDGVKTSMTITGDIAAGTGEAQGSCTGLSTSSSHTITVEFEFVSATFGGPFILATATKSNVQVNAGSNELDFVEGDYTYPDDDGDTISNLDELNVDKDPTSDKCILDHSLIDNCTLG